MKRPSLQFYPADWELNANLGRCSWAARGVWVSVMGKLHDSDEYGVARYPLRELANATGAPLKLLRELIEKGVLKGADSGAASEPYVYVPRSGRRDGPPVTLLPATPGPIWFSSRMVKDEYVRKTRGEGTRFGDGDASPDHSPTQREGDGSSSSSSSSASRKRLATLSGGLSPSGDAQDRAPSKKTGNDYKPPDCPQQKIVELWGKLLPMLPQPIAWRGQRVEHLRSRWREMAVEHRWANEEAGIRYFAKVFRFIAESDFLMGRSAAQPGRTTFVVELPWVVRPENFLKIIEGKYQGAQQP